MSARREEEFRAGLVGLALELGAPAVRGWSEAEEKLASNRMKPRQGLLHRLRSEIRDGLDPLGDMLCGFQPPAERRERGATFTPFTIVDAMIAWGRHNPPPSSVVDPGAGSGRFLLRAGRAFPRARLIGVEIDPLTSLLCRANLAAAGFASRAEIVVGDYVTSRAPLGDGRTFFVGNPPYVRHHAIGADLKRWLAEKSAEAGAPASRLAGLHVYFVLSTLLRSSPGDFGAFVTASEWLDVNYGEAVRRLFAGPLGGEAVVIVEPRAFPFPDAAATACVFAFRRSSHSRSVYFRRAERADDIARLERGRRVRRDRLLEESRWSRFTRRARAIPSGFVELGELFRVHRGQVTGANKVWIAGPHSEGLPESTLFPSVTRARELFDAGSALRDASGLKSVIDLPVDLDRFDPQERSRIDRFLRYARSLNAHAGYVARTRRAWWAVGLRPPAPILATYMARRPPAFVVNLAGARHVNIAHGLYPRGPMSELALERAAAFLASGASLDQGRTYAGGLTKFEPGEMERLWVPGPEFLLRGSM